MGNVCTKIVRISRVGSLENTVGNFRNSGHGTLSATAMQLLKKLLVENNFLETYISQQTSLTATSFLVEFVNYVFIKSMMVNLKVAELNSNEMAVCGTE